jgi:hypothetical protein
MGDTTLLPPSRPPRRTAALADIYTRAPRVSINPSCMANPAETRKPKRPASVLDPAEPPAKRVRGAGEPRLASTVSIGNKWIPCPSGVKDLKVSARLDSTLTKNQSVQLPPIHPSESTAQVPKPSSSASIRELIEKARQAKERPAAEDAMEVKRRRMEARRKLDEMVATVEFNDPFIDFVDVFLSRQQLKEAREAAADAQARIIATARARERDALN